VYWIAANQTQYAFAWATAEANLHYAQSQERAAEALYEADQTAPVPFGETVASTWPTYTPAQQEVRFRAAEAAGQVLWFEQMLTAYPNYVYGMVDAAGDESVALVRADVNMSLSQFDASQAYEQSTRGLYAGFDDAARAAEKQIAKKQRTHEATRSHEQELAQKDYDIAYATSVKVQAVAEATADKSYYIDLYGEVVGGFSWADHQAAYADADLAFAGTVGDADIAWTARVAAAGKAKKLALAPDQQAYKLALAAAQKNISDQLAFADEEAANDQARIQTAYWAAETAAAGVRHVAEAQAIVMYRTGDYAGQADAWTSVAQTIGTPWGYFQQNLATFTETWWTGAAVRQIDLAEAEAEADNTYEATVDFFYEQWVEDTAKAQRIFDLAAADLAYARASGEAGDEYAYLVSEAGLEENYQNALAAQRKKLGIQFAQLENDLPIAPSTEPSDHLDPGWAFALNNRDQIARDALALDYQQREVVVAGVQAISSAGNEIGHVNQEEADRLAFTNAMSAADLAYTQAEASANAARMQTLATNEAASDLADIESFSQLVAALAQMYPSPWATQAAADALAEFAKAQVTVPAARDKFIAEANSERDLAIADAEAQQALAAENFAAESAQRASAAQQAQQQLLTKTNGANPTPLDGFLLAANATVPVQPAVQGENGTPPPAAPVTQPPSVAKPKNRLPDFLKIRPPSGMDFSTQADAPDQQGLAVADYLGSAPRAPSITVVVVTVSGPDGDSFVAPLVGLSDSHLESIARHEVFGKGVGPLTPAQEKSIAERLEELKRDRDSQRRSLGLDKPVKPAASKQTFIGPDDRTAYQKWWDRVRGSWHYNEHLMEDPRGYRYYIRPDGSTGYAVNDNGDMVFWVVGNFYHRGALPIYRAGKSIVYDLPVTGYNLITDPFETVEKLRQGLIDLPDAWEQLDEQQRMDKFTEILVAALAMNGASAALGKAGGLLPEAVNINPNWLPTLLPPPALITAEGIPVTGVISGSGNIAVSLGKVKSLLGAATAEAGAVGQVSVVLMSAGGISSGGPGRWVSESTAGWSERAKRYQEQITGHRAGEAYELNGVRFDGFSDGVLLEAKGPGYSWAIRNGRFRDGFRGATEMLDEVRRQLVAARGITIKWHIAEADVADAIKRLFLEHGIDIDVIFTPPTIP
jgi:hypothetical protein